MFLSNLVKYKPQGCCGVVVITLVLHTKGPQFDPGQQQKFNFFNLFLYFVIENLYIELCIKMKDYINGTTIEYSIHSIIMIHFDMRMNEISLSNDAAPFFSLLA